MSDTSARPAPKMRPETMLIIAFVIMCLGVLFYLSNQRQQQLRSSAVGLNGLQVWLASQGTEAKIFAGGWALDVNEVDLLVLPLHDSSLWRKRKPPTSKEELLFQQDELDLQLRHVREKTKTVKSLVILPKWRTGMRLTGLAHPALLIEENRPGRIMNQLFGTPIDSVARIPVPFSEFDYAQNPDLAARLYVAQVFEGKGCTPIIGKPGAMVLGDCPLNQAGAEQRRALVLSDPDLLSNHGLRLGDNATIAADLLPEQAGSGNIVIDYSPQVWLTSGRDIVQRDRTWDDFKQFFAYPFSILWVGGALVMGIVIWRSGLRYGPILGGATDTKTSKLGAITARARLMRLTGQDGALLKDYAAARIAALSASLYGNLRPSHASDQEAFLSHLSRRAPDLADQIAAHLAQMQALPPNLTASAAIQYVEKFESLLEQTAHVT